MASQLSAVAPTLLPPTITGPIFKKAEESSAVQQLARRVPLAVNAQTAIPVPLDIPEADWVGEGGSKPTGGAGVGVKTMTGKKVALLLPVSQEVAMTNAAGLYSQLQQDLPVALARAFDYAAIHGKSRKTGGAGPFPDYLAMTKNSVELGTAAQDAGGMYTDLVNGEKVVTDNLYDFSGWAADPKLRPTLKLQTDTLGRPIWVSDPHLGMNGGQLIGYNAFYNRGVSGRYRYSGHKVQVVTINGVPTGGTFTLSVGGATTAGIAYNATAATVQSALQALGTGFSFGGSVAQSATVAGSTGGPYTVTFGITGASGPITADGSALTGGTNPSVTVAESSTSPNKDTGVRAVGGDFSQCAYGVGMDISIKISQEASYVDDQGVTHSAFQENLVLLLCEAYYGFVMGDPNAFVLMTDNS
ncbi:MAG TPA: phage major capsid protein [Spirillospora sp.]|nr:phage major capsid protein [Spirillospora sp.]